MGREVTITYYGMIAEKLGCNTEVLSLPDEIIDLRIFLLDAHPTLKDFEFSIVIDLAFREQLKAGEIPQKIDVMPPFAGG